MDNLLAGLRAAGEETRLRLLALLAKSELTVSELTQILRQSQPRVSRHLKLLCEAGLLDRFREGSWVFYRLSRSGSGAALASVVSGLIPNGDVAVTRDQERLEAVRKARFERANEFFRANAEQWNRVRALYVPEEKVEKTLLDLSGRETIEQLVDLGTGTGRILQLFAPKIRSGLGLDLSSEMLAFARAGLEAPHFGHVSVRQGDLFDLPLQDNFADLVTLHQVLHYLDDPAAAINEAARILKPGGRLLIADFAPHELDFLRDTQAHRRLGFAPEEVSAWLKEAGLEVQPVVTLPPEGGPPEGGSPEGGEDAKLTVLVWAADKAKGAAKPAAQAQKRAEEVGQ